MFSVHIGADQPFASMDYTEHDAVLELAEVTVVRDRSPNKTKELASDNIVIRLSKILSEFIVHLCWTTPWSTPAYK